MHSKYQLENLKETDRQKDRFAQHRMVLELIFNGRVIESELDSDMCEYCPMINPCERGKSLNFADQLSDCWLLKTESHYGVTYTKIIY